MPVGAAIGGAALVGAGASVYAANKQSDSAANALAQQNAMYKQTQTDLSPYKKVGSGALMTLGQLYGIGADGKPTGQPYNSASTDAFKNSPDYRFAFDQGMQGLTFSNAAKGLLKSGSNLKDLVSFGQGLASQQFGNYVNRLSGLATMGQNSAAGGATNALGFAGTMGGTQMAQGQAQASGAVGAANSLTGGVGSYLNYNQQQTNNDFMKAFIDKQNGSSGYTPGSSTVGGATPVSNSNNAAAGTWPPGFADGGRPPVGEPIIVGDEPDQNSWGGDGGRPWHGNGWQGGYDSQPGGQSGVPQNGLAAFGVFRGLPWGQPGGQQGDSQNGLAAFGGRQPWGQPGGQPNGLANAVGNWANMLRPMGGQPGSPQNGLANARGGWANMLRPMGGQPGGQPNGLMSASRGFGGLPGFADGGRPPIGEPAIVGEPYNNDDKRRPELFVPDRGPPEIVGANGPEVITMDRPGTIVPNEQAFGPNDQMPLWMESAAQEAPPYHPPLTRAIHDYSSRDPNELAMIRHREMVRPQQGRGDFTPEHLANMVHGVGLVAGAPGLVRGAIAAAPYLSAEGLAAQVATKAPALAAGGLGAVYAGAPTAAGEQEFRWSDPDQSRTKEMADIQNRINGRAAQITTLGTTKTNSPAGTQATTIKALEALNHPEGADMKRLTELRQQAAADRQGAQEQFQYDQDRARQQAEAKRKAETSWFDVVPGSRSAISAAIPFASYYGGKYLGKRLPVVGAMTAGAVGGGLEGALSQYIPTEVDLGLPRTAPARAEAVNDLADPAYWNRMEAVSGGNALLGAYGAFRGAMSRRLPLPPIGPSSAPNMLQAAIPSPSSMGTIPPGPANGLAAVSQALPSQPASNALAAISLKEVTAKNGRTIYMNEGGGFANKENIERFLNQKGQ